MTYYHLYFYIMLLSKVGAVAWINIQNDIFGWV